MEIKTRYVDADNFRMYSGIDLAEQFADNSNPSDQINAFIFRVEKMLEIWLSSHFFILINDEYPKFNDRMKELYKLALMEQMIYMLRNGDISTDSGYDMNSGEVMTPNKLAERTISRNTIQILQSAGLLNTKVRTRWGMFSNEWFF